MSETLEAIAQKAARAFHLIDLIQAHITDVEAIYEYPDGSKALLDYLTRLADKSKKYLQQKIVKGKWPQEEDRQIYLSYLTEIWSKLHDIAKPIGDAHALTIPLPLLSLVTRQMRELPGLTSARIVVESVADFNYFQYPHTPLQALCESLEKILCDLKPPNLPKQLGIVGLPYSQGGDLFSNCILYHELGHFAFEQKILNRKIEVFLSDQVKSRKPDLGRPENLVELKSVIAVFKPWYEELYCDLFAVRMLGPAYTFIMVDVLDLMGATGVNSLNLYSRTHPAPLVRLEQQIALLKDLNWWAALEPNYSEFLIAVQDIVNSAPSNPSFASELDTDFLEDVFQSCFPHVSDLVKETTKDRGAVSANFSGDHDRVFNCLSHGIVPSYEESHLSPVIERCISLINVGYLFQVTGVPSLASLVAKRSPSVVADQAFLRHRIEQWVSRAIEYLLHGKNTR